ncbi:MAG TPA: alpha-L-fucosidase [Thermoguttaceae bacterium]|nr:alpha-L-fucosidase [Thermoguttaceae bacterium]
MSTRFQPRHAFTLKKCFLLKAGIVFLALMSTISFGRNTDGNMPGSMVYEPTWESLARHGTAPAWYENAVFGIYFHWGIYSVPGKETRYMQAMYTPGHKLYEHHCKTYGDPKEFGYHDFIPMFRGEKWDPDRWAKLFKNAGADFAGSIGEHHDGFSMWDTKYSKFNAKNMGPRRDVVGEMARALRKQEMKVVTTFHHLRWQWYDAGRTLCPEGVGVNNPEYSDLYGPVHKPADKEIGLWLNGNQIKDPGSYLSDIIPETYIENGYNKIIEVIDKYQPDQLQIDGGTCVRLGDERLKKMLAYYFNAARIRGKEVAVSRGYDRNNPYVPSEIWGREVMTSRVIPITCSIQNIESHFPKSTLDRVNPHKWQTSTPIPGFNWAYIDDLEDKSPVEIHDSVNTLVDGIVDVTSKNGVTLVGVAPRADGTLPESQVEILNQLGDWMKINKTALHGADWHSPCMAGNLRFTVKGDSLYAIDLEKPGLPEVVPGVTPEPGSVIRMLGSSKDLSWHQDGGNLVIEELPDPLPCDHAWVFRIELSP